MQGGFPDDTRSLVRYSLFSNSSIKLPDKKEGLGIRRLFLGNGGEVYALVAEYPDLYRLRRLVSFRNPASMVKYTPESNL